MKDPNNLEGYRWHDRTGPPQRCTLTGCTLPTADLVHAPANERAALVAQQRSAAAARKNP